MTPIEALRGIKLLVQALDTPDLNEDNQRFLLGVIQSTARNGLNIGKTSKSVSDKSPTNEELYEVLRKSGVANPEQLTKDQLEAIAQGIPAAD